MRNRKIPCPILMYAGVHEHPSGGAKNGPILLEVLL